MKKIIPLIKEIFNGDQFDRRDSNLLSITISHKGVFLCVRAFTEQELYRVLYYFRIKEMIASDDTYGDITAKLTRRTGR